MCAPRINGPRVFGCRPGNPFFFAIAASGTGPLEYAAEPLPSGLSLDAGTGIITGRMSSVGIHHLSVEVQGPGGKVFRDLAIHCGARLALTPPMGWNSWNCWGERVSQENVLASARVLASTLRAHGWSYVNIDDGWQGTRQPSEPHALQPNDKFTDLADLSREIHALGLKFGIYSSPWATTYAHFRGGSDDCAMGQSALPPEGKNWYERKAGFYHGLHSFATADAAQWAAWGVDYLKYDWFPNDITATREMNLALRACGRDIVFSLSNCLPLASIHDIASQAQLWRTTGDLKDVWSKNTTDSSGLQGICDIIRHHQAFRDYQNLGAWNDPDMLVLGQVGWGETLQPTRLTKDEQITHFAVWCLWSAPLLIGCPLDKLDAFTLSLLTNDELIDIDQDPIGVQAFTLRNDADVMILRKPLADGSVAFGLINFSEEPREITLDWKLAQLTDGPYRVRDLINRQDLPEYRKESSALVAPHGTAAWRFTVA